MSVTLAQHAGFCFGVSRAVELVEKAAGEGRKVFTLGPIIHNRFVVEKFQAMGISVLEKPEDAPITAATFKLRPESGWFRVSVYDQNGNFAMTRAYYPEEYTEA